MTSATKNHHTDDALNFYAVYEA